MSLASIVNKMARKSTDKEAFGGTFQQAYEPNLFAMLEQSPNVSVDPFRRPSLLAKLPEFTREQVLANDYRNWIIVGGLVFDLTEFIKIHPGGDEVRSFLLSILYCKLAN